MGHRRMVRGAPVLLRHPGAARGAPLRRGALLSRQPCGAARRPRPVAGRSARHSAAPAAERLAPDLRILHDLRSAHHAGLAPRPLHLRTVGRGLRALARVLHADAAGALRRADRAVALHPAARPNPAGRAVQLDRRLPCSHGSRRIPRSFTMKSLSVRLKAGVAMTAVVAQVVTLAGPAAAFCGFYVAKADAKLFNKSSKVVLARNGQTTAITMASDYEGEPKEFAVVIPVPTFIERKQIGVVEMKTIDHLDAFTAPRLVEYHDADPCAPQVVASAIPKSRLEMTRRSADEAMRYRGVTVEASYEVGEYDISILSARESDGLVNWLTDNGYRIPAGAEAVLGSYIRQNMRFFVAKVNLD